MRAKLVQGTNSMIWANRVLPTFTAAPRGCQSRETTYYLVVRIQIGTKSNWTQTRANACSRACHGGFNRTAVALKTFSQLVRKLSAVSFQDSFRAHCARKIM